MMNTGFVPQGHARIIPIRVIRAWHHESTGTWLSIQALGPSMGLIWRVSDSWGATPCLARVVCDSLDEVANYEAACAMAAELLKEGPPPDLLANAHRSALERSKKAQKAANTRWGKQDKNPVPANKVAASKHVAAPKRATAPKQNVNPTEPTGPRFDQTIWVCDKFEKSTVVGWQIRHKELPISVFLVRMKDVQEYSVVRTWRDHREDVHDRPKYRLPFREARAAAEAFVANGPRNWRRDDVSFKRERHWLLL